MHMFTYSMNSLLVLFSFHSVHSQNQRPDHCDWPGPSRCLAALAAKIAVTGHSMRLSGSALLPVAFVFHGLGPSCAHLKSLHVVEKGSESSIGQVVYSS